MTTSVPLTSWLTLLSNNLPIGIPRTNIPQDEQVEGAQKLLENAMEEGEVLQPLGHVPSLVNPSYPLDETNIPLESLSSFILKTFLKAINSRVEKEVKNECTNKWSAREKI